METDPFKESLERLILLDKTKKMDVMCARGLPVFDIITEARAVPHQLPSWARVKSEKLSYPGEALKRVA